MKFGRVMPTLYRRSSRPGTWWMYECYQCRDGTAGELPLPKDDGRVMLPYGLSLFSYQTAALAHDALVLVHMAAHYQAAIQRSQHAHT